MSPAATLASLLLLSTPVFSLPPVLGGPSKSCPPVEGDFYIPVQNLNPENADWDPTTCKLYLSSIYNCTIVAYDPYTNTSKITDLPITNYGEFHEAPYHLAGIDFDAATGHVWVTGSPDTSFAASSTGNYSLANYTGIDFVYRFDPKKSKVLNEFSMKPVQDAYVKKMGGNNRTSGFQDTASNTCGDTFVIGTFGNSIVKIARGANKASLWYTPAQYSPVYGFGGIFSLGDKLVVSDTLTLSFVTFDSQAPQGKATYVPIQGLPSNYTPPRADGLYAPKRYGGKVALWADDLFGTGVYGSKDEWKTAAFLGLVPIDPTIKATGGYTTASFEIGDRIFTNSEFFQPKLPQKLKTLYPILDITDAVDAFAKDYRS